MNNHHCKTWKSSSDLVILAIGDIEATVWTGTDYKFEKRRGLFQVPMFGEFSEEVWTFLQMMDVAQYHIVCGPTGNTGYYSVPFDSKGIKPVDLGKFKSLNEFSDLMNQLWENKMISNLVKLSEGVLSDPDNAKLRRKAGARKRMITNCRKDFKKEGPFYDLFQSFLAGYESAQ